MSEVRPIALAPDEGQSVANPLGGAVTFKALAEESDGMLTVFEGVAAPGEGPPLHIHPDHDETLYVLEGSMRFRLGDDIHPAPPGTFVLVPRGTPHTWQNLGEAKSRLLICFVPAAPGMEAFFGRSAADASAPTAEAFNRVSSDGEMEIAGPTLSDSHPLPR